MDHTLFAKGGRHRKEQDVSSFNLFLPEPAEQEGTTAAAAKTKKRVLNIVFAWRNFFKRVRSVFYFDSVEVM